MAGALRPAIFTAITLNSIFSPVGRPRTIKLFLSTGSWLDWTHSVSEIEKEKVEQVKKGVKKAKRREGDSGQIQLESQ